MQIDQARKKHRPRIQLDHRNPREPAQVRLPSHQLADLSVLNNKRFQCFTLHRVPNLADQADRFRRRGYHEKVYLNRNRISSASAEVAAMLAIIGVAVPLLNTLTPTEASAPMPICIAPMIAEALPAFRENGASDKAAAFG